MRLNLEELQVETTVMEPEYAHFENFGPASVLWDTTTRPVEFTTTTYSSPCVA